MLPDLCMSAMRSCHPKLRVRGSLTKTSSLHSDKGQSFRFVLASAYGAATHSDLRSTPDIRQRILKLLRPLHENPSLRTGAPAVWVMISSAVALILAAAARFSGAFLCFEEGLAGWVLPFS